MSYPKYRNIYRRASKGKDNDHAHHIPCQQEINLASMGKSAISQHQQLTKHKENVKAELFRSLCLAKVGREQSMTRGAWAFHTKLLDDRPQIYCQVVQSRVPAEENFVGSAESQEDRLYLDCGAGKGSGGRTGGQGELNEVDPEDEIFDVDPAEANGWRLSRAMSRFRASTHLSTLSSPLSWPMLLWYESSLCTKLSGWTQRTYCG